MTASAPLDRSAVVAAMRSTFEANPLRYAKDSNLLAEDTARAFGHPEWIADDDSDAWVWAAEVIDGD